jgi:hypothetical protein
MTLEPNNKIEWWPYLILGAAAGAARGQDPYTIQWPTETCQHLQEMKAAVLKAKPYNAYVATEVQPILVNL